MNRAKINSKIAKLVYQYWKTDHGMTQLLARGDLIRELQFWSDEVVEKALAQGYREGREDFGTPEVSPE